MQQQAKPRSASFLFVMSWVYLILALGMIGLALYNLTDATVQLTFRVATDSVFLIIGGVLGIIAGIFGLVSKNLKRCRRMGAVLLAIAAVPLSIQLIAGAEFADYWKNIAVMLLPFLYLIAALIKRSEKKAATAPYVAPAPAAAPAPAQAVSKPSPSPAAVSASEVSPKPEETEQKPAGSEIN